MKINISNLSEGIHDYQFDEPSSEIGLDERFSNAVSVQVKLEKRRRQLFLTGHIETSGKFVCDRCLDNFDRRFSLDYRMAYVYDESDAGEVDRDEITVLKMSTNVINIDEDVKEYVLLAIPLKLLCKEDCAGLCGKCGENLNHASCNCPKEETDSEIIEIKPKRILSKN